MSAPDPLTVVAVLFDDVAQLDFTGPAEVFAQLDGVAVHVAAATEGPVRTDGGWSILPTATFDDAPAADVLLVPGGAGVDRAIEDPALLGFVRRQARAASWAVSVCTGSLILGAAGLLRGRRATTHWASLGHLAAFGATPVRERVVRDGRVVTGAGVSAGLDLALVLAAEWRGEEAARQAQLALEYDPQPPYDAGSPERVPRTWAEAQRDRVARRRGPAVARAAARLAQDAETLPQRG